MLTIYDEKGTGYSAQAEVALSKGVNGEKSLTGTLTAKPEVLNAIDRGWKIVFKQEEYIFTYAKPVDTGDDVYVDFDAVHVFFYDMSKSAVDGVLNGSHTWDRYLKFVFQGSGYTYQNQVDVKAFEKQNFGHKNRLALFYDLIKQAGVEFSVNGSVVRIIERVGNDLSTVVKKGFNLNELVIEKNINDFVTYQKGYGAFHDEEDHSKGRLEVEYLSPLAEVYGRLDADPIVDERYTNRNALLNRLKANVEESYQISVQMDLEDLNRAGYEYDQPHEGDVIMAINEDIGFKREVRIVSYKTHYDFEGTAINHEVTCNSVGSVQKSISHSNGIVSAVRQLQTDLQIERDMITRAQASADGKSMNYYGPVEPTEDDYKLSIGDTWFDSSGEDIIIKVWNGVEWRKSGADVDAIRRQIEEQQEEIESAQATADEAVDDINQAVQNAGFTSLDETISSVQSISNQAQTNAQTAITNSVEALGDASTALDNAQTALNRADTAISSASNAVTKADEAMNSASNAVSKADDARVLATNLSGQVSGFETTVAGFNQTVNNYTGQVSGFRNDILGLESTVANYESEVDEFGDTVATYATEVSTMRNTVSGFESTVATYGTEVSDLAGEVVGYKNQVSTFNNTVSGFNSTVANYAIEVDEFGTEVAFYATEVSTLTNTISGFQSTVSKVEQDYADVSGTVATHTAQISNLDGEIALKANTTTVNALTGRVDTAETGITTNANDIKLKANTTTVNALTGRVSTAESSISANTTAIGLKASQSSVDTLTGTVNTLSGRVDVTAGQISSKVWNTDIQTAIDDIEVGGRNYFVIKDLTPKPYPLVGNDHEYTYNLEPNTTYTISTWDTKGDSFRVNGLSVSYSTTGNKGYRVTTDNTGILRIGLYASSGETDQFINGPAKLKLEKGTIATDWTPAPEDTDAKIDYIETEWTQTFDAFSQTVSDIDGRVTAQKQTIDTISSTVSGHGSRISTVEQTASGLQTTVASKANQSQVTQLANGLSSVVTDLDNLDIGGRNLVTNSDKFNAGISSNGITSTITSDGYLEIKSTQPNGNWLASWASWNSNFGYAEDSFNEGDDFTVSFLIKKTEGSVGMPTIYMKESMGYFALSGEIDTEFSKVSYTGKWRKQNVILPHLGWRNATGTFIIKAWKLEKGNKATDWTPAPEDTQSQISQLSDNINLRVAKNDVINQINISNENILIQSENILLDGDVTVRGTAWMDGAVLKNLSVDGAKITNGTIGSAKIANMDVDKLNGNLTNFFRTNWSSAAGGNVAIDGNGIVSTAPSHPDNPKIEGSQTYIQNGIIGTRQSNGATIGQIGYIPDATGSPVYRIRTTVGSHFAINQRFIDSYSGYAQDRDTLFLTAGGDDAILRATRFHFTGTNFYIGQFNHYLGGISDSGFTINGKKAVSLRANEQTIFIVSNNGSRNYATLHANLNMGGNTITNQSDERLKTDISPADPVLDKVSQFDFNNFKWRKDGREDYGVIAQQVEQVAPELVMVMEDGYKAINSNRMQLMTTQSVKEVNEKVDSHYSQQQSQIAHLQMQLDQANREIKELKKGA